MINGTTVNVIPAIAKPLPLDDVLALIPKVSPIIDNIKDTIRGATPDSPITKLRKRKTMEKIPDMNETMAEPSLSFRKFTTLDLCGIICDCIRNPSFLPMNN